MAAHAVVTSGVAKRAAKRTARRSQARRPRCALLRCGAWNKGGKGLRALLKTTDLCAQRREEVARVRAEKSYEARYDLALEVLKSLPYDRWRNANAEDTLRRRR